MPPGANQPAAMQVDTASILESAFTTQGGVTLIPSSGAYTIVAFFSVPTGTDFVTAANYPTIGGYPTVGGAQPSGGEFDPIILVPEPTSLSFVGLWAASSFASSRRRRDV